MTIFDIRKGTLYTRVIDGMLREVGSRLDHPGDLLWKAPCDSRIELKTAGECVEHAKAIARGVLGKVLYVDRQAGCWRLCAPDPGDLGVSDRGLQVGYEWGEKIASGVVGMLRPAGSGAGVWRLAETMFCGASPSGVVDRRPTGRQLSGYWSGDDVLLRIDDPDGEARFVRLDEAGRKALRRFLKGVE